MVVIINGVKMSLKGYKIFSILFIVILVAILIATLFYFKMAVGQKIVLALCELMLIGAMAYNLRVIVRKEREDKEGEE